MKTKVTTMISLLFFCYFLSCDAAKIFVHIPIPSVSHQIVFRPLYQELAKRGHEVTVVTTDPAFPKNKTPENLTEIDVHDVSYEMWRKELSQIVVGEANDMKAQIKMFYHLINKIFAKQLKDKHVNDVLRDKKFDLVIVEGHCTTCLILSHIYKAPLIVASSLGIMSTLYSIMGAPTHPILYPTITRQRLYNLTLWEKLREIYSQYAFENIHAVQDEESIVILKGIFGKDTPTINELNNNIDMMFVNEHPIWNDNRPVPPNVIFLGGLHQKPAKELPKELKAHLDASKHGVIYISFGTNVQPSILPPEKVKMMLKVLSELPYDVIWKWDTDLPGKSDNIKIFNWLPQSDLLRHPKIKLFVTQGGLQSTDEAITAGVPLIGIPFIADQWYNVEKYVYHRIGLQLEIGTFTEKQFKDAILTVIEDESYRNNIIRLRTIINDQPQTPLERAVWWTEHVLRHGGAKHLRTPAFNMSWAEYLELDLVLIILSSFITALVLLCAAVYYAQRFVFALIVRSTKSKIS